MFIELTDHLRCPADHPEQFLILLPDEVRGRRVITGHLGCPVCGRTFPLGEGVADLGGGDPACGAPRLTAAAVQAFLGLQGPGGYVALGGETAALHEELSAAMPGVHFAAINPPRDTLAAETLSVLRSGVWPLKKAALRGVVLGTEGGSDPAWMEMAAASVLPGLRIVGATPPGMEAARGSARLAVLAEADGCWVAERRKE